MSGATRAYMAAQLVGYQVTLLRCADPEAGAALHAAPSEFLIEHRDRILELLEEHNAALEREDVDGVALAHFHFRKLLGISQ